MDPLAWPLATIPAIRLAGRFPLADRAFATTYCGQAHALHLHDYSGAMRLGGATVALEPGDVTISPRLAETAYDLPVGGRHWCIHFREGQAGSGPRIVIPLHLRLGGASTRVRERMAHIARSFARGNDDALAAASAALDLQQLLLWLAERAAPQPKARSPAEHAAEIIDERFHEAVTVPLIAREVGISQGHLARAFRARFGVTIPRRLLERRVEHAQYLLEATDLPIWRVAERVGIADPQYFNKLIRRFLGDSPTAIRATSRSRILIDPDR